MVKFKARKDRYIKSIKSLTAFLAQGESLADCTLVDLDFREAAIGWMACAD